MFEDHDDDGLGDDVNVSLSGFAFSLAKILVVLIMILLANMNVKAKQDSENAAPPAGNIMIEMHWPSEINNDIDLWVQGPDGEIVSFRNKSGRFFNLLRDDRGNMDDVSKINYEMIASRGILAGEYVVNVKFFARYSEFTTVPVNVVVSVKGQNVSTIHQILFRNLELGPEGQQLTVFRFSLDKDGHLIPGSVNNQFKPLDPS